MCNDNKAPKAHCLPQLRLTNIVPATTRSEYGGIYSAVVCHIRYNKGLQVALRVYRDKELVQVIIRDEEHQFFPVQFVYESVPLTGSHAVRIARVAEVI